MDLLRIKSQLEKMDVKTGKQYYGGVQDFARDVNRIFSNVAKVWNVETDIGKASGMLQAWWISKWMETVPALMTMKVDAAGPASPSAAKCGDCADGEKGEDGVVEVERGENFQEQIGASERTSTSEASSKKWFCDDIYTYAGRSSAQCANPRA